MNSQTKQDLLHILQSHYLAAIATISEDGVPHTAAVYYMVDDDLSFYFFTKQETNKFIHISNNDIASLLVTDEDGLQSLSIEGSVINANDQQHVHVVTEKFDKTLKQHRVTLSPLLEHDAGNFVLLRLTPTKIRWACFSEDSKHHIESKVKIIEL